MLKHRKLVAIVLSLMMVLCLTPTIAFAADGATEGTTPSITINGGKDITAYVGIQTEVRPAVNGVNGDYHIHWKAECYPNRYVVNASSKKLDITAKFEYAEGEGTVFTAFLYEGKGDACTKPLFVGNGTPECTVGTGKCIAEPATVRFSAVAGADTEQFNPLGIKLKKIGTIEKTTVVDVERWGSIALEAAVDDKEYTYKWTKGDGKEVVNFIDSSENELSNIDEAGKTVTGNPIKLKGLVPQEGTIEVEAFNKTGELQGSAKFTVRVVSDMKYGQQGSMVSGYKDAQTVEIVKIGDKIVTDSDIDGTKGIKNPGEAFTNSISDSFDLNKDAEITLFIGKGMGEQFDEGKLKDAALSCIQILNKDGKRIDNLTKVEYVNRNIDRSITVKLPISQLETGKYILRFNEDLAPKTGGQPLGANVNFWFTVGDPVPVIGDYDVISKVEINKNNFEITQDLKDSGIDTKEKVLDAMYDAAVKLIEFDVNGDNSVVYDVTLLISTDGGKEWKPATKENFPKEGIKLELDYPEGTSATTQDFEVLHMVTVDGNGLKAGDVEKLNVKEGKDKLQVTVNSLSPFMIVWQDAADEAGMNDGSAETGDNMNIALYAVIMILALCGGAAVFARRRKEQ